jgi:DNA-binding PadR family transcriptional regulator
MTADSELRISENTVLGILALRGKMSGYEVRKWIVETVTRIWEIKEQEVRVLLEQLLARGFVQTASNSPKSEPFPAAQAQPVQKVDLDGQIYSLTPAGYAEFEKWLGEPPVAQPARNEFLLKVVFAGRGKTEDLIRHMEAFHKDQIEALRYNSMAAQFLKVSAFRKHADQPYWILVNKYGKHLFTAMKDWSEAALDALQSLHKTT